VFVLVLVESFFDDVHAVATKARTIVVVIIRAALRRRLDRTDVRADPSFVDTFLLLLASMNSCGVLPVGRTGLR
jgi:hypothetical protein